MKDLIEPRVLKGFRDFLPDREIQRLATLRRLEEVFRLFSFAPIDTPVLEYADVLLGKGGGETDKQVYRFRDHGDRDVALRFDLTVPFARFMATHLSELPLPFRRWHAAKVWRGENTQRGRYREFVQVDFDIVGADSASADLEILLLMRQCMMTLGMERCMIHFAHRGVFNSFLDGLGIGEKSVDVLRAIDKDRKVGPDKTRETLVELAGADTADRIARFIRRDAPWKETLSRLSEAVGADNEGVQRLTTICGCLEQLGISSSFALDPSITRGLDYYTGVVFETFLSDLPGIGSVCSGGRYNDLASLYTRQSLPGVGASIGIDRLMAAMEELGLLAAGASAPGVLVFCTDESLLGSYHALAAAFRAAGIPAEVFPEPKKLAVQFSYAEKKGIPLGLVPPEKEDSAALALRDLRARQTFEGLTLDSAIEKAKQLLR
ncbi:MAG TPA: histidine--tRNA ligase [Spirochaetia bacterium]|nr:histidine--tRNA ligase [Spirochaetia bacterium]